MSIAGLLGAAAGAFVVYLFALRDRRGSSALEALPPAARTDPALGQMKAELAAAARNRNICWGLLGLAFVAALVSAGLDAGDNLLRVFGGGGFAAFGGVLVFGIRYRVLQVRVARYSEKLAATHATR